MKNDLDFDELDRAVGAALAGKKNTGSNDSSQPASATPPVTEPAATATEATSASDQPETPSPDTKKDKPKAPSLAVKRSSGRFMDVVHPSSDMKKTSTTPVKRSGNQLQPLSSSAQPDANQSTPVSAEPTAVDDSDNYEPKPPADIEPPEAPEQPEQAKAPEPAWPDPLDVAAASKLSGDSTDEPAESHESALKGEQDNESKPDSSTTEDESVQTTHDSSDQAGLKQDGPFINSQPVEKRPLGAFADHQADDDSVQPSGASDSPDNEPDKNKDQTDSAQKEQESETQSAPQDTAEEVADDDGLDNQEDVPETVETKDDTSSSPEDQLDKHETDEAADIDKDDTSSNLTTDLSASNAASEDVTKPATAAVAGQSIARQYQPSATDNDQAKQSTPVFDTNEYHRPLDDKPAGRKSKVAGIVGLVILLILIGIAIGYAFYVYRTNGFSF